MRREIWNIVANRVERARDAYTQAVRSPQASDGTTQSVTIDSLPPERKRRGRPQTISDEKKKAALELKESGGTNAGAAALLYDTKFPDNRQKRNVPSILKNYKKKQNQQRESPSSA